MLKIFKGPQIVYAHCDIPCGIYDPHRALVSVLTVIRMIDLITDGDGEHDISRYTTVKDEHAEICKQETRIIWGDYFKKPHIEKYPELHELTHKIMQLASMARQDANRKTATELLKAVNRFAEIFWKTKGVETKRVKSPYEPSEEIVYPLL